MAKQFFLLTAIFVLSFFALSCVSGKKKSAAQFQSDEESAQDEPARFLSGGSSSSAAQFQSDGQGGRMNGVWVAAVSGNFPRSKERTAAALKADIDFIVGQCALLGFNAIFFQVRPSADALYASKKFPWSAYLSGELGKAPDEGFDPLAYFCRAAKKNNIALHAWINPYRIKAKEGQTLDEIAAKNKALKSVQKCILPSADGNFYLNPAEPRARRLIVQGVKEILKNYDVSGIHLDDYFYPVSGIDDSAAYKKYGGGMELGDFRRENVNALVRDLSVLIKKEKPDCAFGISPFGIWANKSSANPKGSDTRGTQSYSAHFADSVAWIKNGWIDYIAPQIYWERGHRAADYETLALWWNDAVEGSGVKLFVGIADYKAAAARENPDSPWFGTKELSAQLQLNRTLKNVSGEIHFNFDSVLNEEIKNLYENLAKNGFF